MNAWHKSTQRKKQTGERKWPTLLFLLVFILTVILYVLRLEEHTRMDIFLPTNYHAILEAYRQPEGEEPEMDADLLGSYYQAYARQKGRPYTIRQDLLLSRLACVNPPAGFAGETHGATLGEMCDEIERILADPAYDVTGHFDVDRESLTALVSEIGEQATLGELVIREFIAGRSGLTGYVLGQDGEITIALRGTDDLLDILDNVFLLPFNISAQYAGVRELLSKYAQAERIWLTGHSKGGYNAIYAASIDQRCHATGFNAPGFGILLSDAQHDGLDRGVNYVINGDVTGFLLFHLERRIVLEPTGAAMSTGLSLTGRHRLHNFFAIDDLGIATEIAPLGVCSEWVTQILWLLLIFLAGYLLICLLRRLWAGIISGHKKYRNS